MGCEEMAKRYESLEQKDPVELDREETEKLLRKNELETTVHFGVEIYEKR